MEADGCIDALIVPDDDVGAIEVEALDEHGRLVARGTVKREAPFGHFVLAAGVSGDDYAAPPRRPGARRGRALARTGVIIAEALAIRPEVAWVAATGTAEQAGARRDAELAKSRLRGSDVGSMVGRVTLGA
jgi:hypothetical protein